MTWSPDHAHLIAGLDPLAYFTAQEMQEWRDYQFPHYVNGFARFALYLILNGWFVFFGGSRRVKAWCDRVALGWLPPGRMDKGLRVFDRVWGDRAWVGGMLFVAVYLAAQYAVFVPIDAYFALVYDKVHGLSTYTVPRFIRDVVVDGTVQILLMSVLCFALFALIRRMPRWWIPLGLVVAVGSFFSGVIDPYRTMLTFKDKPLTEGPVYEAVEAVLKTANVENAGIFVRNASRVTTASNALFVGQGPTRRIILFDNLLTMATPREIAAALAHETGHLTEGWFWPSLGSALSMFLLIFVFDRLLRAMAKRPRFGLASNSDPAALPVVPLMVALVTQFVMPVTAAYHRSLERKADARAIEVTKDPEAFISLMVKVNRAHKEDVEPPAWFQWKKSHPLTMERIAFGEAKKRELASKSP